MIPTLATLFKTIAGKTVIGVAVVTMGDPRSRALTTASAEARSFSDAVGWRPSSLTHNSAMPSWAASRGARYRGVPPTVSGGTAVASPIGIRAR